MKKLLGHWPAALCLAWISFLWLGGSAQAEEIVPPSPIRSPDQVFASDESQVIQQTGFDVAECVPLSADDCYPTFSEGDADGWLSGFHLPKDSWIFSDTPLLHDFKNQTIHEDWHYNVGGALRFRFIDESNRLRPPATAGRSSYRQWRFSPFVEAGYKDWITGYAQLIDASTFNNDLPIVPTDENRWDLLQAYVDVKALDLESGDVRYRYGRQTLLYGAQHLISPLGWGNTFRNFQGHRAYYVGENWNIDALAVNAVNGAARGYLYNLNSFDAPDQDRKLSGIYATYKNFGSGSLDFYWLWSDVDSDVVNVINGDRHTIGMRYAGKKGFDVVGGDPTYLYSWDMEGAYQFGHEGYLAGPDQDLQAGFFSTISNLTFEQVAWKPTVTGLFWWGSGDNDPNDGTSHTVSTLYPLGHAYWGMIDNFNGSNLLDYSAQASVKPAEKLTLLSAWHWFDKAARNDAIYNVGGVPYGGVTASPRHLGTELDLMATYQVNKNLQLQMGYFWFWYGDAVNNNPNPDIARDDAEQIYFLADWAF